MNLVCGLDANGEEAMESSPRHEEELLVKAGSKELGSRIRYTFGPFEACLVIDMALIRVLA